MPLQKLRPRPQLRLRMEHERHTLPTQEGSPINRTLLKTLLRHPHQEVVALRLRRPQTCIEHPMCVGSQGETIAGVVVTTLRVLVDMGGMDDVAAGAGETVAGERTGEPVTRSDLGPEADVPSLLPTGLESLPVFYLKRGWRD